MAAGGGSEDQDGAREAHGRGSEQPVDLRPGEVFADRYRVVRRIGIGSMGAVYEVVHLETRRRRALKVLLPTFLSSPNHRDRFAREATVAADVDSEHLVEVVDAGVAAGVPFLAMELLQGEDLGRLVKRRGKLPAHEVVELLAQAASALDKLHAAGIVHRDLKPGNVFVCTREDGSPRVKILDLGIAKLVVESADAGTASQALGTPLYMSPEQIRGKGRLGPGTDIYALAHIAFRLLTGASYWEDERRTAASLYSLLFTIGRGAKEPASARAARYDVTLPPAFDTWFARATALSPDARGARASAVVADLAAALGEDVPAPPSMRLRAPDPDLAPPSSRRREPSSPPPSQSAATMGSVPPPPPSRSATARASVAPSRRRTTAFFGVAALGVIAIAIGASRSGSRPAAGSEAPARREGGTPVTVTDLPSPTSPNAAAIAAYREGLRQSRDGDFSLPGFERALALDPTLAEAHLQLAARAVYDVDDGVRRHFIEAFRRRESFSARDRAMLSLLEPVVAREPSDWAEASRRARDATTRFPEDAQLWLLYGITGYAESMELVHEHTRRALELDPRYGDALGNDAEALAYLGRFDEAKQRLAACAEIAPDSTNCQMIRVGIDEQEGACDRMEASVRRMLAAGGDAAEAYDYLASALAAQRAPAATVREALHLHTAALPEASRRRGELEGAVRLALLSGDFAAAEQSARALAALADASPSESEHAAPARWLAQILEETGRRQEAGRVAEEYLARRAAWQPDPRAEDFAMARDPAPLLIAEARRAGAITAADAAAQRDAWLQRWDRRVLSSYRSYLWMHGYAPTAETEGEARAALAELPRYGGVPPYRPMTLADTAVGVAFHRAGRTEEAIAWLEGAARSCRALQFPVEHTHAHYWLGQAREARGETAAACAAYEVVINRWGAAKPRSITAEAARARVAALGCKR
jgi:serine/threonine-protein kinase